MKDGANLVALAHELDTLVVSGVFLETEIDFFLDLTKEELSSHQFDIMLFKFV